MGPATTAVLWLHGDFSTFDRLDATPVSRALTEEIIVPLLRGEEITRSVLRISPGMFDCVGRRSNSLQYLAAMAAKLEMEKNNEE